MQHCRARTALTNFSRITSAFARSEHARANLSAAVNQNLRSARRAADSAKRRGKELVIPSNDVWWRHSRCGAVFEGTSMNLRPKWLPVTMLGGLANALYAEDAS